MYDQLNTYLKRNFLIPLSQNLWHSGYIAFVKAEKIIQICSWVFFTHVLH